jgi:hypothetical protein
MPTARLAEFHANATRARDLVGLGQSIGQLTYGRVDASDLYRAALVQVVAALDTYIHAIVEDRAVAIVVGRSMAPAPGPKFGLTPSAVADILSGGSPGLVELTARKHIAQRLALETFQRPDDIAAALASVGINKIWSVAFPDPQAAKIRLGLIVTRRNLIAHQCDVDPLIPGSVILLTDGDAVDAITTVVATVTTIDQFC